MEDFPLAFLPDVQSEPGCLMYLALNGTLYLSKVIDGTCSFLMRSVCITYIDTAKKCYDIAAAGDLYNTDVQAEILQCTCHDEFFQSALA